jgi:hypothetical protein
MLFANIHPPGAASQVPSGTCSGPRVSYPVPPAFFLPFRSALAPNEPGFSGGGRATPDLHLGQ